MVQGVKRFYYIPIHICICVYVVGSWRHDQRAVIGSRGSNRRKKKLHKGSAAVCRAQSCGAAHISIRFLISEAKETDFIVFF